MGAYTTGICGAVAILTYVATFAIASAGIAMVLH